MLVGQSLHVELYAVLAPHPVLEHVELQGAHDAHDDLLQAGAGQLENLDGALLGDLLRALDELLALHGVLGRHPHEVLRLEGGNAGELEFLSRHRHRVADGEDAGVKHADDVPGVGLVDDLPLRGHHLLGL